MKNTVTFLLWLKDSGREINEDILWNIRSLKAWAICTWEVGTGSFVGRQNVCIKISVFSLVPLFYPAVRRPLRCINYAGRSQTASQIFC